MHVAIIHYHLHPGGVTRIIESQINAMKNFIDNDDVTVHEGDIRGGGNTYKI